MSIVAISTAPGIGGIGIIRMSGEDCFEILNKIFHPMKNENIENIKGYSIKYGTIEDSQNNVIDEVLVSYFKAPKSYTTENMCEISSHGGSVIMNQILELCLKNGAKLAEPGEFTKLAFLNGRIDLAQAEAVIDVINSKTNKEAEASVNQLKGYLSENLSILRKELLSILADIEASIDYPEYDIEETTNEKVITTLEDIDQKLKKIEDSFETGKILKYGVKLAIVGKPNVGKSSLLNIILNEERAIVTEFEGTTRDSIEEYISIKGIPIKIVDTAGIRETNNEIEKIGIKKSKEIAENSDILVAIFDISRSFEEEDKEILELIKGKNAIILLNKIDLVENENDRKQIFKKNFEEIEMPIIEISTKENKGIEKLNDEIIKIINLNELDGNDSVILTNVRHKNLINEARQNLNESIKIINNGLPIDIISSYVKTILESLGKITGETASERLHNRCLPGCAASVFC